MVNLPTLTVAPSAPHTHTVVFLHGRGGTADNLVAALAQWRDGAAH
jgi:predicted esterase